MIFSILFSVVYAVTYDGYRRVELEFKYLDPITTLELLNSYATFNEWSLSHSGVSFSISGDDLVDLKSKIELENLYIYDFDLQARIAETTPTPKNDFLTNFFIFISGEQYAEWMNDVRNSHAGTLENGMALEVGNIGNSYLNAEIPSFTFRRPAIANRPSIGIDCAIHSREWISAATCRLLINELVRCSANTPAEPCDEYILNHFYDFDWYIIPMTPFFIRTATS